MTDLMVNLNSGTLTMSSREIETLTGKRHGDVLSDIRKMCVSLEIDSTDFSAEYKDRTGRSLPCFNLPKRESLILVSGYNVKMRAAIVDRWQELEEKPKEPAWITGLSPQAKIALEDLGSQVDHYKTETSRLQTVCNDLALNLREGMTVVAFCRSLNGVNLSRVQPDLVSRKRLLSTKHGYRSASAYRDKLFTERHECLDDGRLTEKVILTRRGAKWLYAEYENDRLLMKKDWNGEYTHILFDDVEVAA